MYMMCSDYHPLHSFPYFSSSASSFTSVSSNSLPRVILDFVMWPISFNLNHWSLMELPLGSQLKVKAPSLLQSLRSRWLSSERWGPLSPHSCLTVNGFVLVQSQRRQLQGRLICVMYIASSFQVLLSGKPSPCCIRCVPTLTNWSTLRLFSILGPFYLKRPLYECSCINILFK